MTLIHYSLPYLSICFGKASEKKKIGIREESCKQFLPIKISNSREIRRFQVDLEVKSVLSQKIISKSETFCKIRISEDF